MADRSFIWCPYCEKQMGAKNELFSRNPEVHLFKCVMGHSFEYGPLMAMNPEKIPLEHHEKPGDHDVKTDVWVNSEILTRFKQKYPEQLSSTVNSILQLKLDDDLVIISGEQARKLKSFGVRNGADMVAAVEVSRSLEGENADLVSKLNYFSEMLRGAGVES